MGGRGSPGQRRAVLPRAAACDRSAGEPAAGRSCARARGSDTAGAREPAVAIYVKFELVSEALAQSLSTSRPHPVSSLGHVGPRTELEIKLPR
jgi:hypothetical protein